MASFPRVRGACEYCHHRKIRCIVPVSSSSCHNCSATGVTCFFAPRLKSGRPRRSTSYVTPDTDSGDSTVDTPSVTEEHLAEMSNYHAVDFAMGSQNLFPSRRSLYDYTYPYHSVMPQQQTQSQPPSARSSCGVVSDPSISPTSKSIINDSPTSKSIINDSPDDTQTLGFDAALKLCTDLDHRARLMQDVLSLVDAETHVQSLDAVCMASITIQSSTDSASRSIVLAVLYKALEMSHVLVRVCTAGTMGTSRTAFLRRLLVLRKLDVVVTFCKICFECMGSEHASGVKQAEDIHASIEHFFRIDRICYT